VCPDPQGLGFVRAATLNPATFTVSFPAPAWMDTFPPAAAVAATLAFAKLIVSSPAPGLIDRELVGAPPAVAARFKPVMLTVSLPPAAVTETDPPTDEFPESVNLLLPPPRLIVR